MDQAKDQTEKKLEDFEDVFADIVNVLLFDGKRLVKEEDLETGMVRSSYTVGGKFDPQERDTKKYWRNGQVRLAVFGLENQTGEDPDFPFRGIAYDGADYRDQLRTRARIRRENAKRKNTGKAPKHLPSFYPVVTLVLYFGDSRWNGSPHLKDHLTIPDGLEDYVSDYTLNLFEIAYLTDEQVEMFTSDFRYVAEYFVGNRKVKEGTIPTFNYPIEKMRHVEAVIELLNAVTNTDRFSDLGRLISERGNESMFTTAIDEAEMKGKAEGKAEGIIETLISLVKDGLITLKEAARRANMSESAFSQKMMRQ